MTDHTNKKCEFIRHPSNISLEVQNYESTATEWIQRFAADFPKQEDIL